MGQAGIIDCPREEGQVENTVEIAVGNINKLCTGFDVFKTNALRTDIRICLNFTDGKSADCVSGLRQFAEFRLVFFRQSQALHQFCHVWQPRIGGSLFNNGRGIHFLLLPKRAS